MSKYQQSFPIIVLGVTREDISYTMGYNLGDKLTDEDMKVIAGKLGDALRTVGFWLALASVVKSWLEKGE